MSACSSAEGSSVALRKQSSVRNRPTPCDRLGAGLDGAGTVGDVGQELDRDAVGGRGGARPLGQGGAGRAAGLDPVPGLVGVAPDLHLAGLAVDDEEGAAARSR